MDTKHLLEDLAQLLDARLSQTEERIVTQLRAEIKESIKESEKGIIAEMHQGFDGVADILTAHNDQLDDHETRLTRLETKAA